MCVSVHVWVSIMAGGSLAVGGLLCQKRVQCCGTARSSAAGCLFGRVQCMTMQEKITKDLGKLASRLKLQFVKSMSCGNEGVFFFQKPNGYINVVQLAVSFQSKYLRVVTYPGGVEARQCNFQSSDALRHSMCHYGSGMEMTTYLEWLEQKIKEIVKVSRDCSHA